MAGVSRATVPRVFNQPVLVSPETRGRVQEAVDKLRYLPNILTGSMAANRSRVIGLMLPASPTRSSRKRSRGCRTGSRAASSS